MIAASTRLVDRQGVAEPVFWDLLISLGATLPSPFTVLVDRAGMATPVFQKLLGRLSTTPPRAAIQLIDMPTGQATSFFFKFLGGLS